MRRAIASMVGIAVVTSTLTALQIASPASASLVTIADGPVSSPGYSASAGVFDIEPGPNGSLIIGGIFDGWGPQTGGVANFGEFAGNLNRDFPWVIGTVNSIADDGAGGYYIGGEFTSVRGVARTNLAHVRSDGSVSASWAPNPNGVVNAIAVSDGIAYVGGAFTNVGGQARNRLAAINAAGTVQSWNPNANGTVNAIAVSAGLVYFGGAFTQVAGPTDRNRLAAVSDATTGAGAIQAWDPDANGTVNAIAISGANIYVGGAFTQIQGMNRNRVAQLIGIFGGPDANWAPDIRDGEVRALAIAGGTVYVGGTFTNVAGQTRLRLAAFASGGLVVMPDPWDPVADEAVNAITIDSDGVIYVGGGFTVIGGLNVRNGIAALTAGGTIDGSRSTPNANGVVRAVSVTGDSVVMGGTFTSIDVQPRRNLLAVDANGGLLPWNPWVVGNTLAETGEILAMQRVGSALYFGGRFTSVAPNPDAVVRNNAAAINVSDLSSATPDVLAWDPDVREVGLRTNYRVRSLAVSGSTVFIGGTFDRVAGDPRSNLAAVDAANPVTPLPWAPNPNGDVFDMVLSTGQLWLAGEFTFMGGQARSLIAAMDPDPAAVTVLPWTGPGFGRTGGGAGVYRLLLVNDTLVAGGKFQRVDGETHNSLVALNSLSGAPSNWRPNPTVADDPADIWALALIGGEIFIGGDFDTFDGQPRDRGAAVDASLALQPWNPGASSRIYDIAGANLGVALGGIFEFATGASATSSRAYLAYTATNATPGNASSPITFVEFVFKLADGRECTSISPQRVRANAMFTLPDADAECRLPGSTIAGWRIPGQLNAFAPGRQVLAVNSQQFTAVLEFEWVTVVYSANVAEDDSCVSDGAEIPSDDRRTAWSLPRNVVTEQPLPRTAPCTPPGYELIGWTDRRAAEPLTLSLDARIPAPAVDADGIAANEVELFAAWRFVGSR